MKIETNILATKNPSRPIRLVETAVMHRIRLAIETEANPNPVEDDHLQGRHIHEAFKNRGLRTGGLDPYEIMVRADAVVEQMLALSTMGQHAGGYNSVSIGVAFVGNFDEHEMMPWMHATAVEVFSILGVLNGGLDTRGHCPDLKKSGSDPSKRCPGKHIDMDLVRRDVKASLPPGWQTWSHHRCLEYIEAAGFII